MNLIVVFSRKYRWPEHCFSIWSLGNSQKLLKTNQFLVSAIFFTIMSIFFFSFRFDLFSIIGNNVVCIVARLVFLFCCALTTSRCNAFQHNFVNQKRSTACISRLCYFLWLWFDTVSHNILLKKLKLYDIENNDLRCFKSYLSRRKQQNEN